MLENARYRLLDGGRAVPSGWDIALVLMGHVDIAPSGPVRQPGLLTPADPRKPMLLSLRAFAGSAANYRSLMRGLTAGLAGDRSPIPSTRASGRGSCRSAHYPRRMRARF